MQFTILTVSTLCLIECNQNTVNKTHYHMYLSLENSLRLNYVGSCKKFWMALQKIKPTELGSHVEVNVTSLPFHFNEAYKLYNAKLLQTSSIYNMHSIIAKCI